MSELNQRQKEGRGCRRLLPYILVAVLSAIIVIIAFIKKGIAPFGGNSLLCMDLWGQYLPMYVNNKEAANLSELLYSWNGAFGFNNWAQSAYYCNSIFVFLLRFVPYRIFLDALDIFCLSKVILSAITCLAFLQFKFKKRSPILIAGAVSYSVCAYMLAYMSQPMWTDMLFLAPLVLIGIDRLVYEKKFLMYTLVLAISIMSNFYIGFSLCIFSAIYFAANSLLLMKPSFVNGRVHIEGAKEFGFAVIRFGVFSLLAGAISAVVIIPMGLAISKTIASGASAPDKLVWYGNFTSVLRNMLPKMQLFVQSKGANIACGIIVFLAVPLYFINRRIRLTERIVNAIVMAILILSLNCNILNYIWHGFHFPNQLPGRWTFLFSLFVIMLSCKGILNYDKLAPKRAIAGCSSGLMLFYVVSQGLGDTPQYDLPRGSWGKLFIFAILILIGTIAAYFLKDESEEVETELESSELTEQNRMIGSIKKRILKKSVIVPLCAAAVAFVAVFDSASSFIAVSQYEGARGTQVSDKASYVSRLETMNKNGHIWKSGENDFYRVEANRNFTFGSAMIGNYRGIGYYSSTMNGGVYSFLRYMGNRIYTTDLSSVYNVSSPVQNGLFGVKYFMDFDRNLDRKLPGTVVVEENEDGLFRENPNALPLAYAVSDSLLNYEVRDEIHAIQNQNELLNKMCGEEINVFQRIECTSFVTENVTLEPSDSWNRNYFHKDKDQTQAILKYCCRVEENGNFFFEHNFRAGSLHVTAPDIDKTINYEDGRFAYVGQLSAGDTVNIEVVIENIDMGCYGLEFYKLDEQRLDYALDKLAAQGFHVTSFKNTRVDGTIALDSSSLVFASIPDDGGWKVYCDGEEVPVEKVCGAFVSMRIPQGDHEISLRYHVPGLAAGLMISGFGLVALGILTVCRKRMAHIF